MHSPTLIKGRFTDSDEWSAAIADWNLEFQQLDRGPLAATIRRVISPQLVVQRVRLSRRFHQRGFAPEGVLTFGIADQSDKISWYGRSAQRESMMNFNRRNGFDAVSEAGFSARTISVSTDLFQCEAAALSLPQSGEDIANDAEQFLVDSGDLERIRVVAEGLDSILANDMSAEIAVAELQDDLVHLLVRSVARPRARAAKSSYSQRQRAVDRAIEFITSNKGNASIGETCQYSGISYRTLNRGFKERFGIGPKRYIVATRLAGVRQALKSAHPGTKITDVATDWGFWHLGRFASDYRMMHGELPSNTLENRFRTIKHSPRTGATKKHL